MPLPLSVIVTLQDSRKEFFCSRVMPAIVENDPAEIIVELGLGGASEKRNRGWRKARQPFLFFCDDDVVLGESTLPLLCQAIKDVPTAGLAYGHYRVVHAGGSCNVSDGKIIRAKPFDLERLRDRNSISVMSLIRSRAFPGWDENLKSYIDWDCWLTMARQGWDGILVDAVLFDAYYLDRGISTQGYGAASYDYIARKHGL